MPPYAVCCLSSINLPAFVKRAFTPEATFDMDSFTRTIEIGVRFLDNVLTRTNYPLDAIEKMSTDWRRIGLGFTGLADTFAMIGVPYGSAESKVLAEEIANTLRIHSYMASIALAKEKGSFPKCDPEKLLAGGFIGRKVWPTEVIEGIKKYGLRNIGLNTTAPVGTTSLSVGNNCSSGIEPIFSLEYNRRVRQSADTDDVKVEKVYDKAWLDYIKFLGREPNEIPVFFNTTVEVDIDDGMEIQAIFQNHIDHSISKTLNLPPGTTIEQYQDIYKKAYNLGLKGLTTFNPEGSMKGILEYNTKDKKDEREEGEIEYHYAPPRPKDLECDIHEITVNKTKMLFVVGLLGGSPYEIFVDNEAPKTYKFSKHKKGVIRKRKKGCYDLLINDDVIVSDLSHTFEKDFLSLARSLSMSLRHGVPLQFIVTQMGKDSNFGSFQKGISRVLKMYIAEGEEVKSHNKKVCSECGGKIVYQDGCVMCLDCGSSKCG